MSEHTPGNWDFYHVGNDFRIERADREDGAIAIVYGTGDEIGEADARLIAPAPQLLEALKVLLPGLVLDLRCADHDDDKQAMQARIETVTTAIAAATGEPQK